MTKLEVHVGGSFADTKKRVLDAVGRATDKDGAHEDHITFATWDALASIMTTKRFEMLRYLHANPQASVAALARSLSRDYKRVHQDVDILLDAGLIERKDGALTAQYNEIRALIAL
jgi:predicted transcriptional regulator